MSKWPENRGNGERLEVYRVVIQADVPGAMGLDRILEEIAELTDSNDSPIEHWDVFDVDVQPRAKVETQRPA